MRSFIFIAAVLLASTVNASIDDVMDATCKVITNNGAGTGVVFDQTDSHYLILTAGHVLHKKSSFHVEFYHDGYQSQQFAVTVRWNTYIKDTSEDLGVLELEKDLVKDLPVKIIPLGESGLKLQEGDAVVTCGSAEGAWLTAFRGRCTEVHKNVFRFVPMPMRGRSGSAICDRNGTRVIGIIILNSIYGDGVAVSIEEIHRIFDLYDNSMK